MLALVAIASLSTTPVADAKPSKPAPAKAHAKATASKATSTAKPRAKAKAKGRASVAKATPHKRATKPTRRAPLPAAVPVGVAIGNDAAPSFHDLAAATPAERAAATIEALYRGPLRVGTTSIFIADATTGEPLFSVQPDRPLNPASNVKLLSTAAALDLLGPTYQYKTRVLGATPDAMGIVRGGVYLYGSYDPTLTASNVRALAADLVAAGVRKLDGDVVIGDLPTRDGIYRAGLNVEIRAGALGKPAVASLPAGYAGYDLVEIDVSASKTRKRRGDIKVREERFTDAAGHPRLRVVVTGQIGRGRSTSHWISFDTLRGYHAAHVLRAGLRAAGVELTGDVRVASLDAFVADQTAAGQLPVPLAEHASAPLADIVAQVNKRSINWLADRVIMTAAAARFHEAPSMTRAIDAMHEWLDQKAATPDDIFIDTGSGLSHRTQLSARHIVNVLRRAGGYDASGGTDATAMATSAQAYLSSLSIAGVDGTLRHRFSKGDAHGHLRGKTGTLSDSVALSGFLEVDPARPLAFSFVTNGHPARAKLDVRRAHEALVGAMCEYLRATGTAGAATLPTGMGAPDSTSRGATPDDDDGVADDFGSDDDQDPAGATMPADES